MTADRRRLSEEDITDIVGALVVALHQDEKHCRFQKIDPIELHEAVAFIRNFNIAMADSRRTVRTTLIKLALGALVGLILLGAGVQLKKLLMP